LCEDVLFTAGKLDLVCYPGGLSARTYITPEETTTIRSISFAFTQQLGDVTISDSVATVGDSVLGWGQIANISIPGSITPGSLFTNAPPLDYISVPGEITSASLCEALTPLFETNDPSLLWLENPPYHSGAYVCGNTIMGFVKGQATPDRTSFPNVTPTSEATET
jgi:hypothetical protein